MKKKETENKGKKQTNKKERNNIPIPGLHSSKIERKKEVEKMMIVKERPIASNRENSVD